MRRSRIGRRRLRRCRFGRGTTAQLVLCGARREPPDVSRVSPGQGAGGILGIAPEEETRTARRRVDNSNAARLDRGRRACVSRARQPVQPDRRSEADRGDSRSEDLCRDRRTRRRHRARPALGGDRARRHAHDLGMLGLPRPNGGGQNGRIRPSSCFEAGRPRTGRRGAIPPPVVDAFGRAYVWHRGSCRPLYPDVHRALGPRGNRAPPTFSNQTGGRRSPQGSIRTG